VDSEEGRSSRGRAAYLKPLRRAGEAALAADLQFAMDKCRYSEKECRLSGTAVSYLPKGGQSLGTDGQWGRRRNDSAGLRHAGGVYPAPLGCRSVQMATVIRRMDETSQPGAIRPGLT